MIEKIKERVAYCLAVMVVLFCATVVIGACGLLWPVRWMIDRSLKKHAGIQ